MFADLRLEARAMFARALSLSGDFRISPRCVWISAEIVCFSPEREASSFRDRARSFGGKNVQRFVKDRREHVFRSVTNLTGYHGLGRRSVYETARSVTAGSEKEGTSVARIWIIVRGSLRRWRWKSLRNSGTVTAARSIHEAQDRASRCL